MKDRVRDVWDALHSSFWFVPAVMAFAALLLSFVTIRIDQATSVSFVNSLGFIWSGGADGARSILSTVAGSMITVAGVVFSIVIVALTLASSQFGPRLLRNFVRDTGNQITLGTFIATFPYCLLVLRTVRVKSDGNFIPYISITCGMALAVASIGVLIYFIHHVSTAIQAENVIARVGHELMSAIDQHFPEVAQKSPSQLDIQRRDSFQAVRAPKSGYLQSLDRDELIELGMMTDSKLVIVKLPGDFAFHGDILMQVYSDRALLEPKQLKKVLHCFTLGDQRTESQDVRYGARQLSEIASRALSPGINDPYTAMGCIDWASAALARVAQRHPAPLFFTDKKGVTRLKLEFPATFDVMCAVVLNPLIAYGLDSAVVTCHLLLSLQRVAETLSDSEHAAQLTSYIERIKDLAQNSLEDEPEKAAIQRKAGDVLSVLARIGDARDWKA